MKQIIGSLPIMLSFVIKKKKKKPKKTKKTQKNPKNLVHDSSPLWRWSFVFLYLQCSETHFIKGSQGSRKSKNNSDYCTSSRQFTIAPTQNFEQFPASAPMSPPALSALSLLGASSSPPSPGCLPEPNSTHPSRRVGTRILLQPAQMAPAHSAVFLCLTLGVLTLDPLLKSWIETFRDPNPRKNVRKSNGVLMFSNENFSDF